MAVMFPTNIRSDAPQSEKDVFEILKRSAIAGKWIVYHSEYTDRPDNPARPPEMDFVIFVPEHFAIICLEAKGGSYETFEAGRKWRSVTRRDVILEPPPPEKVRSFMFDLQREFRLARFNGEPLLLEDSLISYGCAIALPDGNFPRDARMPKQACILEARDIDKGNPDRMVAKLEEYAESVPPERIRNRLSSDIMGGVHWDNALGEWDRLRNYLEYDVTITRDLRTIKSRNLNTLRPELLRLTEEQIVSLDAPDLNESCVIDGAAGTGKTVLALELARRRCEEDGKNVAFMCSNSVLVSRFERWARTLSADKGGSVSVGTPATLPLRAFELAGSEDDQIMHELRIEEAEGIEDSLKFGYTPSDWTSFIRETVADLPPDGVFDYLVVDEAQNLCDETFLVLMDRLLKGGLADGYWAMFGDFANQDLVSPSISKDVRTTLRERGLRPSYSRLRTNCRNTEEIAYETARYSRVVVDTMSGVYGPEVLPPQYYGDKEELTVLLDHWIDTWRGNRINPERMMLLSIYPENGPEDEFKFDTARGYGGLRLLNIRELDGRDADIRGVEDALVVSKDDTGRVLRYGDVYDFLGFGERRRHSCASQAGGQRTCRGRPALARRRPPAKGAIHRHEPC